jgi:hypothetical protein
VAKRASSAGRRQGTVTASGPAGRKATASRPAGKSATKKRATGPSVAKSTSVRADRAAGSRKTAGKSVPKSATASREVQLVATPAKASRGGGDSSGGRRPRKQSAGRANAQSHRITPEEALDNTRSLLAAKKVRDRQPPPWQEPGLPQPNDAKGGYESDSARDRARELHQGEMGLKAIEADVAGRDQRKQGKRDSR